MLEIVTLKQTNKQIYFTFYIQPDFHNFVMKLWTWLRNNLYRCPLRFCYDVYLKISNHYIYMTCSFSLDIHTYIHTRFWYAWYLEHYVPPPFLDLVFLSQRKVLNHLEMLHWRVLVSVSMFFQYQWFSYAACHCSCYHVYLSFYWKTNHCCCFSFSKKCCWCFLQTCTGRNHHCVLQ